MQANAAVEMGRRATMLHNRMLGLEALANHFGERAAAPSAARLSGSIVQTLEQINRRVAAGFMTCE